MRNPYFPMYQQPKEEVVPVYAVVSTETPSSSSSNYGVSLFEWQSPSQGGYRIANIGSVAVGQLQGFVGGSLSSSLFFPFLFSSKKRVVLIFFDSPLLLVGTGAVVAGTGVVAGASIATAGTGAAALTAAFGMGCATIGNEVSFHFPLFSSLSKTLPFSLFFIDYRLVDCVLKRAQERFFVFLLPFLGLLVPLLWWVLL